jgi:NitT/TauT family transport system permease protein
MNKNVLRQFRKEKIRLILSQIGLLIFILAFWEVGSRVGLLDEFFFSKPSSIAELLWTYIKSGQIWKHISISVMETLLGIILGSILGIFIAVLLWSSEKLAKVLDPFMILLNALPKTALAPILIIWAGTGVTGIVVVAISILIIVTILSRTITFGLLILIKSK